MMYEYNNVMDHRARNNFKVSFVFCVIWTMVDLTTSHALGKRSDLSNRSKVRVPARAISEFYDL